MISNHPRREELLAQLKQNSHTVRPAGNRGFTCDFITSADLDAAEYPLEWIIEGVMVEGQPAIWGGEKKTLKTSIAIDLAVSLGARSYDPHFLGHFDVPNRKRVLVLSGESGEATIQETVRRVCRSKNVSMLDMSVHWSFRLPRLSSGKDITELVRVIRGEGEEIVIFDPLYLCLLAGNSDLQAANLYHIGPLLRDVSQACLEAGATPIMLHHAVKRKSNERNRPMELSELSFAGVAEFARQWLLLSHRRPFDPNDPRGAHQLWMNVGGSAGFHGLWGVDITQGQVRETLRARHWGVRVMSADSARQHGVEEVQNRRTHRASTREADDSARMLEALAGYPDGETQSTLADEVRFARAKAKAVLNRLIEDGRVERCDFTRCNGRGTRPVSGYRLVREDGDDSGSSASD